MRIERLADHDVSTFDSGEPRLDNYLRNNARKQMFVGYGVTYVAVDEVGEVAGYYTISFRSITPNSAPPDLMKRMPKCEIPTMLLGKLAVRKDLQGRGTLGPLLLADVYIKFRDVAEKAGVRFLELNALSERAKKFYERYGFRALADDPLHLFKTRQEILAIFDE